MKRRVTIKPERPETAHQGYWDRASKASDEFEKHKLLLCAAVLGHYRALSAFGDVDQKALVKIINERRKWQKWCNILDSERNNDALGALQSDIIAKTENTIDYINNNNRLPGLSNKDCFGVSRPKEALLNFSGQGFTVQGAVAKLVLGQNAFLEDSCAKRRDFAKTLDLAERGELVGVTDSAKILGTLRHKPEGASDGGISFSEHRVKNHSGQILEMLKLSRKGRKTGGKKNTVIFFGGKSANYYSFHKGLISIFQSLPDCDELWFANTRNVSLAASYEHATHDQVRSDIDVMYQYTQEEGGRNQNVTIAGYCMGSPAACDFARRYKLKFFSDRSFQDLESVVKSEITSWVYGEGKFQSNSIFASLLNTTVLRPIFQSTGHLIDQSINYSEVDQRLRVYHVIQTPSHDQEAVHDIMTHGSGASLNRNDQMIKEESEFDHLYKQVAEQVLGKRCSTNKKRELLQLIKDQCSQGVYDVMNEILAFHQDRKSYIPTSAKPPGKNINPHLTYVQLLHARNTGLNPMWRFNLLVKATTDELSGTPICLSSNPKSSPALNKNRKTLIMLCNHVKPVIVELDAQNKLKDLLFAMERKGQIKRVREGGAQVRGSSRSSVAVSQSASSQHTDGASQKGIRP